MDEQTLNLISAISGVVSLIAVIVFFVMAGNVAKIARGSTTSLEDWKDLYEKEKKLNRAEAAKEALKEIIWIRFKSKVDSLAYEEARSRELKELQDEFQDELAEINMDWPKNLK